MDQNQSIGTLPNKNKNQIRLLFFLIILFILAGVYFFISRENRNISPSGAKSSNGDSVFIEQEVDTERNDFDSEIDLSRFLSRMPFPQDMEIKESYNLVFPKTGEISQTIVVSKTDWGFEQTKQFYLHNLTEPEFNLQENFGIDSENQRTFFFGTKQGTLVIGVTRDDDGSTVILRLVRSLID